MGAFRVAIYGIMAAVFTYTLVYDILYMPRIGHTWWIYKLIMLTNINLVLQTSYYVVCLICSAMDVLIEESDHGPHTRHPSAPSYWRKNRLRIICDFMYYTSAFPVGTVTCALFWLLYAINPQLVMPDWISRLIPPFMNHVTHTAPVAFILVDTLLTCHHAPPRTTGLLISFCLATFYFLIILMVRLIDGYWIYPLLEILSPVYFILLYISSCVGFCLLYLTVDCLNAVLWGRAPHALISPDKPKKR
ncbi:hypothetical protein AB6A40_009294 [Gnathostoma spinigerum]|uniref:Androgen-induced gene 1 protein-like n=1 Tax=Gnathostoma spinigerum TaxID=75299 RepID=A0ABD6ESS9_9BILA